MQVHFSPPDFTEQYAVELAREYYGLSGDSRPMPSERDRNFYLLTKSGSEYVLKISNTLESKSNLELQHKVLHHLLKAKTGIRFPELQPAKSGEEIVLIHSSSGHPHFLRLFSFLPGCVYAEFRPHSRILLENLGEALASVDGALQNFSDPKAERELKWDLARADWIGSYIDRISGLDQQQMVRKFLDRYCDVLPKLLKTRRSVIYNDANDYNILVQYIDSRPAVSGFIDFGDVVYSHPICDLAVGAAYALLHQPDPLTVITWVAAGYHRQFPLTEREIELLFPLICTRLSITVTNAAFQRMAEPDNEYLIISEKPAWEALKILSGIDPQLAHCRIRHACGFPASPASAIVKDWLMSNSLSAGKVLDVNSKTKFMIADLGVGSPLSEIIAGPKQLRNLTSRLSESMHEQEATVAVGRYDETRVLVPPDQNSIPSNDGPQWRTLHLGIDLFASPATRVYAPLDAVVHSVAKLSSPYDYGPLVILQHEIKRAGITFFTLYGHLSADSLDEWTPGKKVSKGTVIGRVGESGINGGWPPHLHFQIICDLLGFVGDFPGNASPEERDFWLEICPDPNLILRIPGLMPRDVITKEKILQLRSTYSGPSLSISYQNPLHIRRGWMQYLFDETGRAYLDCVNNVAHVGHCHPNVVEAGIKQMRVLNTNTRYLHELLVKYAQKLSETLPSPLRVCFFVNSGSEANELAIRLARAHTKMKDLIVFESGYHGNTSTLIDASAYKFDGPGGSGPPSFVHKVSLPDLYRGKTAEQSLMEIESVKSGYAAFLAETMPGCGGQIILPEGYLQRAYKLVRSAGGVCIADEVQTGFGRPGTNFWAFETQGVIPDIVTLGKPIGNGHPLGAVVTTPEIAASFSNGMEFFSTFGGNPVSCAIGLAVLEVIQREKLQHNAQTVGTQLLDKLSRLKERHRWIGDVRGRGLYIGIELVRDRQTKEPAALEASYIINRMRDQGILLSTDGPFHNVIKIKPPMIFNGMNADFLCRSLDQTLLELRYRSGTISVP